VELKSTHLISIMYKHCYWLMPG